ncbi:MAG: integral rane sensor signal transduction histidine kinase [Firmicutes bacterium]|nr:integral rane sensor signal transduction histidine kinase [Bacillota bacterium]
MAREQQHYCRSNKRHRPSLLYAEFYKFHGRHHYHNHARFLQQYRYFRYLRPVGILFTLIVFYIAFHWGGSRDIGFLIVGLFAAKEVVHYFLMLRLEKRIFTPMIELKKGLDEVAKKNYAYKVENTSFNDLSFLIDAFNEMTEKLYESEMVQAEYEENRKALVTNISHDLKTPITAILGYVEALLESGGNIDDAKRKYLKIIQHNTVYVNKLIDDLFLFAKLDMQKLEFHFQYIAIKAFMDDLMEEYRLDLAERNVNFCYQTQIDDTVEVALDGKRFQQALHNIITNAVQYGPETDLAIQVTLYSKNQKVGIDIQDNGPGIAEEKIPFLFDRFYRLASERPKEVEGTGLGLAIARELIEAHEGRISVRSKQGEGSCFTIMIPAACRNSEERCL